MAQLIVRNLEEAVKERIRKRARQRGHSMEEEARDILRSAVTVEKKSEPKEGAGTRLARRFAGIGIDFEIPEIRGYEPKPAKFGK